MEFSHVYEIIYETVIIALIQYCKLRKFYDFPERNQIYINRAMTESIKYKVHCTGCKTVMHAATSHDFHTY